MIRCTTATVVLERFCRLIRLSGRTVPGSKWLATAPSSRSKVLYGYIFVVPPSGIRAGGFLLEEMRGELNRGLLWADVLEGPGGQPVASCAADAGRGRVLVRCLATWVAV